VNDCPARIIKGKNDEGRKRQEELVVKAAAEVHDTAVAVTDGNG
jgi:hypothetical protein